MLGIDAASFRAFLKLFGHALGALFIAYLFAIVLMVASAQSGVADQLARLSPQQNYSTAYANWRESQERDKRLATLWAERDGLRIELADAEQKEIRESDQYGMEVAPVRALRSRLAHIPGCVFDLRQENPIDVAESLSILRHCLQSGELPRPLAAQVNQVLEGSANVIPMGRAWLNARRVVEQSAKRLAEVERKIANLERQQGAARGVRESFNELAALDGRWLIGGSALAGLPPSMTQIVLAFAAGLFGALLITLVLLVYPKNKFQPSSGGGGVAGRVLLGGLISLCVFVVLGGGTAVLGASSSFADGEANFLAFCAIGILAGMFSDRVASWLSDRADSFFAREEKKRSQAKASQGRGTDVPS